MRGGKDLSVPDIYIYILTLFRVTNLYCKINLGDKFVLYLIPSRWSLEEELININVIL